MRRALLAALFTLLLAQPRVEAQTRALQSLKSALTAAPTSADSLTIALRICAEREALSADTLTHYATLARRVAAALGRHTEVLEADFFLGLAMQARSDAEGSIRLADARLGSLRKGEYGARQKFTYLKAAALVRLANYKEALDLAYTVLRNAEERRDTLMQAVAANVIGWACMEAGSYPEAVGWLRRTTALPHNDVAMLKVYGIACSNLAAVYNNLGKLDSGTYFINESIAAARRSDNLRGLANALAIQADGFLLRGQQAAAEAPLREALDLRRVIGDAYYIVSDMAQLATYYAGAGQPAAGIRLMDEALVFAKQHGLTAKLPLIYEAQADCYKAAGDYPRYARSLEQLLAARDSLYNQNTDEALSALQAKYDVAKAENMIIRQRLALLRQNALLIGAALLVLLVTGVSVIVFRRARAHQRRELARVQEEDRLAAENAVREAEEAERKRIAADLHDNLGAYAAAIASNIDHLEPAMKAPHVPGAGFSPAAASMSPAAVMQELRTNSRDMVSQLSDTIWVLKKDALPLTAISDRLKVFVQRIGTSHPAISIEVLEDVEDDRMLSPMQAFHLFRIVQEAVNNAVRHSGGTRVVVLIESNTAGYQIRITDNGRGMNRRGAMPGGEGAGLHNMRTRAEASGWQIAWHSAQPQGTEVCIVGETAGSFASTPN